MSKVVLSVAAHGSDAEFMAGGTLAKMAAGGDDVYLAIGTDNSKSSLRLTAQDLETRALPEAEASAAALGANGLFMLGYVDGGLCEVDSSELRGQIMHLIRQVSADVVFSWDPHAPFENHPDHRAMAWAAADATRLAHLPLFHPEHLEAGAGDAAPLAPHRVREWYWYSKASWGANKLVDISGSLEQKLAALRAYDSQMVLMLDEFLAEARLSSIDEAEWAGFDQAPWAGIDSADHGLWIEMTVRALHSKLGAAEGVAYAEAFRYESLGSRDLLQSL